MQFEFWIIHIFGFIFLPHTQFSDKLKQKQQTEKQNTNSIYEASSFRGPELLSPCRGQRNTAWFYYSLERDEPTADKSPHTFNNPRNFGNDTRW